MDSSNANPTTPTLAVDVGGTFIRSALIDHCPDRGKPRMGSPVKVALPWLDASGKADLGILTAHLRGRIEESGAQRVGIGFPGFFDRGLLTASPNLPGLNDLPLASDLSRALGLPVAVENDANCAALGIHRFGLLPIPEHLVVWTLGTGVGGGLILGGKLWTGMRGMAGELGHLTVEGDSSGRLCGCGNHGCLETVASVSGMLRTYLEASGQPCPDGLTLHRAALRGDPHAQLAFERAGTALGLAMTLVAKTLDVTNMAVGGGGSNGFELMRPALEAAWHTYALPPQRERLDLHIVDDPDRMALWGAAVLAGC